MKCWTEPSPSDWQRWEDRLAQGEEPAEAARAERQTCGSFKRSDPLRHGDALAMSRRVRMLRRVELMTAPVGGRS